MSKSRLSLVAAGKWRVWINGRIMDLNTAQQYATDMSESSSKELQVFLQWKQILRSPRVQKVPTPQTATWSREWMGTMLALDRGWNVKHQPFVVRWSEYKPVRPMRDMIFLLIVSVFPYDPCENWTAAMNAADVDRNIKSAVSLGRAVASGPEHFGGESSTELHARRKCLTSWAWTEYINS